MDFISNSKDKLGAFRIKELKDVLTQLGLPKQGKKQDLADRILASLSGEPVSKAHGWSRKNIAGKEGVAKIIDDIYRKMQGSGATDLAMSASGSEPNNMKSKEEVGDSFQPDMKVRCPCGSSLPNEPMIQCKDPWCQVWQHNGCVIIPEKPTEGASPEDPSCFYCEICRINRADPFWVTLSHPLNPVKLQQSAIIVEGANALQSVEKTFQLSRYDRELLQRTDHDLQVWCILLNDRVSFRMQWPQFIDLQVNGIPIRTTNRPGTQLLGINGRDDGPVITTCSSEGINKVALARSDARVFCFGIRIARRRSLQQVLGLVPKEVDGENLDEALARVRRCIGGGTATDDADSDSDLEVVADSFTVNLRCPMSGSRIKTAGRFKPCAHMACFDLETFVELNQRSRKWQCPICLNNYSLEHIIIDPYFNRITSLMKHCGEDVTEIDVKPDGSWRARGEGDLAQWHLPDGSVFSKVDIDVKPNSDALKQIKQEVGSEGQSGLRLGIKRRNGIWAVSKSEECRPTSSGNHVLENIENHHQNIMQRSSATGSYRDGDDPSVNMDNGTHFEISLNNGNEFDCLSFGFGQLHNDERNHQLQLKESDVIVLSDSEDDNVTVYDSNLANGAAPSFSAAPLSATYPEDHGLRSCGTSSHGLFNNDTDDFGMPLWSLQTGAQPASSFQLFGTDTETQEALVDIQQNPLGCPPVGSYSLFPDGELGEVPQGQDISTCHSNNEMNANLVNNPLTFNDDPSLQIFLPSRPGDTPLQDDANHHNEMTNNERSDGWISLSLGGTGGQGGESATTSGLILPRHPTSRGSRMDALATASLLLSSNEDRPNRSTRDSQRSDGTFSHPWQERSSALFSHPRQDRSTGPFSHPRQPRSSGPFSHSRQPRSDGPFSHPRQQRSDGSFSHPRQQRSDGPFSHPRQPRSVRPRLYLSIDTDSE